MSKFKNYRTTLYKVELDKSQLDKFKPKNAANDFKVILILYNKKHR